MAGPRLEEVHQHEERRPSAADAMKHKRDKHVSNQAVTGAAQITTKQSIWPIVLVTILFFLWGFAYGLLDILNKHFQEVLDISKTMASGLQAAYFGYVTNYSLSRHCLTIKNYQKSH